jgi:hypothetical protein
MLDFSTIASRSRAHSLIGLGMSVDSSAAAYAGAPVTELLIRAEAVEHGNGKLRLHGTYLNAAISYSRTNSGTRERWSQATAEKPLLPRQGLATGELNYGPCWALAC